MMWNKKKKQSQKLYEEKLCMGFNGGSLLYKKVAQSQLPLCHAILESLAKEHQKDPIFQGLFKGLEHEYSKLTKLRNSQLKKAQDHQSNSSSKGWSR